jgi:hypothetical protein
MCSVRVLITNGILRMGDDVNIPEESRTSQYVDSALSDLFWQLYSVAQEQERRSYLPDVVGDGTTSHGSPHGMFK